MTKIISFYVYKHVFILSDNRKITRCFITLRDKDKNIIAFTDFHKYIRTGKSRKSVSVTSTGEPKFYAVCKFLNYAFFESRHRPKRLIDIKVEMIREYLNDYGLARLEGDTEKRDQKTVDMNISAIIGFFEEYLKDAEKHGVKTNLKKSELYTKEKHFSQKTRKFIDISVPAFKVSVLHKEKRIFRDIFEGVFTIIMDTIMKEDPDILMLAALSAFGGLRPSEACNVFRQDSPLGEGIRFIEYNGQVDDIVIDLNYERPLRSDGKSVGDIKKERMQRIYPAFIGAFMDCYNFYMKHMEGRSYEAEYMPLTINTQGKAMTYKNYLGRFEKVIESARARMLESDDPKVVTYGKQLSMTNLGPHIFRHWFSVKLVLFGEDVAGLQYWRGDKSPQSALTYISNKSELIKQLNDVSSELFDFNMWQAERLHDD